LESSLLYATTPIALASLAIIAGVGILKLVASGRNNVLSRLITHYGFAVVIVFGLLGNAAYLYGVYISSEVLIFGSVVDSDGHILPNVTVDTGGRARGMSSDAGEFVLAIPASRVSDSYEITAALAGYERAKKTIKNSSRMSVRFELQPKKFQISDMIKLTDDELLVGHYMGLPDAYVAISVENPTTTLLTVNNFNLSLTAPSGNNRQLILASSAPSGSSPSGPVLPQVQVKAGEKFSWIHGFVQYDNHVQQLAANAEQALRSISEFRQYGPRVGKQVLQPSLTNSIQQALLKNWFWEPGDTTVRLSFSANGSRYELVRKVTLSKDQVNGMQRSSDHYSEGYGMFFGSELLPVGNAQPGHRLTAKGV
jgi:hypothetical protein